MLSISHWFDYVGRWQLRRSDSLALRGECWIDVVPTAGTRSRMESIDRGATWLQIEIKTVHEEFQIQQNQRATVQQRYLHWRLSSARLGTHMPTNSIVGTGTQSRGYVAGEHRCFLA